MTGVIQSELDSFECYVLNKVFGDVNNIQVSKKLQLFLISKNIKLESLINEKIQLFEEFAKDYITDTGYVDGEKLSKAITTKFPVLKGYITLPSLKPIEYAQMLDNLIGFEAAGQIIKNI